MTKEEVGKMILVRFADYQGNWYGQCCCQEVIDGLRSSTSTVEIQFHEDYETRISIDIETFEFFKSGEWWPLERTGPAKTYNVIFFE